LEILKPLTYLINISFEEGICPDSLKKAQILPIYKKGSSHDVGNYRPISLLQIFSKVYEKPFLERLLSFLNKYDIISPRQFGFCKGKSTSAAVNELLEFIVTNLDNQNKTLSIFLDLSKAFDCVEHDKLINILYNYGVRGLPLKWLRSYLSNRTQQVKISNTLSNEVLIKNGVLQRSILGPVLFIIYVNRCIDIEFSGCLGAGRIVQYADDTTLNLTAKSLKELEALGQQMANSCVQFFDNLNMKTNFDKTFFMQFGHSSIVNETGLDFTIGNHKIRPTETFKFLGLMIDRKLTWNDQIDIICKRMASGIFLLRKLSSHCSADVLRLAYFGLIHPHILYGIIFWGNC